MTAETRRQFVEMRAESQQQFAETRQRFAEMRAETQQQFSEVRAEVAEVRQQVVDTQQRVVDVRYQFDILAEHVDDKIDVVREVLVGRIDSMNAKIHDLAIDMTSEFADVRSMLTYSHRDLDRRVRVLEGDVSKR